MLDPFKSQEERFFWRMVNTLPQVMPELSGTRVITAMYEAFSLRLGSTTYTPDFLVQFGSGNGFVCVMFEIKGSKKQKGYRETRAKLREAASLYPMFVFCEVLVNAKSSTFETFEILSLPPLPYLYNSVR
jgi:hypothetical protein